MHHIIMMVPDTLIGAEAVNSPSWSDPVAEKERLMAARLRIQATERMNRNSDEQIIKSKLLMSKGVTRHRRTRQPVELA